MKKRFAGGLLLLLALCGCELSFSTVGSWTQVTGPRSAISTTNVVALHDGRIAIIGGLLTNGQPSNDLSLYNPLTGITTKGAPVPESPLPDIAALLQDGTLLVEGGGFDSTGHMLADTWLYDPARNTWTQAGDMIEPRFGPSTTLLSDGRLLIAGGAVPVPQQAGQTAGGQEDVTTIATAEIFDPATRQWTKAGQLEAARNGIALVAIGGGGAVAAGGCQGTAGWSPPVTAAEVYDPTANAWHATTSLPIAICGAAGTTLKDGRALIVDQVNFSGIQRFFYTSTNDAFVYDPKARTWALVGGLASGGVTTLVLNDGRVFVPEVQQGAPQGHTFKEMVGGQIFDPASNQWTFVSTTAVTMPLAYMFNGQPPIAFSLPDGTALVVMQTAAVTFHPQIPPPSTQLLDSTGLTFELGAAVIVIVLLLVLAYRRAIRSDPMKLA